MAGAVSTVPLPHSGRVAAPADVIATAADFDGDGILDPAVLRGTVTEVTLSRRHATITLQALPHTTGLAVADIDHDGDLDLVSIADEGLRGWSNQRSGDFHQWTIGPARPLSPVEMAAVHWTSGAPILPPATIGRIRTDVLSDALGALAPQVTQQRSYALLTDRAPPRLIAFDRPSRAPPRIFIS